MELMFYKYQGAGNDFILIDNRARVFPKDNAKMICKLCDRHFGIGADGLILLENDIQTPFKMVYYNADGKQGSMCGNGGRCIVAFAHQLGLIQTTTSFSAIDGLHHATIKNNQIALQMQNVDKVSVFDHHIFVDTGSPHHIELVTDVANFPVFERGNKIRNQLYGNRGSNVNFVQQMAPSTFSIRTYERGVEDETLACGTGATAVAIAMYHTGKTTDNSLKILVKGGELTVCFKPENSSYKNVFLKGEATFVFQGNIDI